MVVDVYADLFFLINAGMDWLCLSVTARLLHCRPRVWRLLAAAGMGGFYAVVALFFETGVAVSLAVDGGVCILMCVLAFDERGMRVRRLLGIAAVYVALSMVMGGVMTALFNLLNRAGVAERIPAGEDGLGAWLFALTALAGSVVSLWGGRLCRRSAALRFCTVTLELGGRTVTLRGLVDTGNFLRDPLGGRPVICATADSVASLLSPALATFIRAGDMDLSRLGEEEARRLRIIPTGTATGASLLVGLRPDRVELVSEDGGGRAVDAVVAISPTPLSLPTEGASADALVPAELI